MDSASPVEDRWGKAKDLIEIIVKEWYAATGKFAKSFLREIVSQLIPLSYVLGTLFASLTFNLIQLLLLLIREWDIEVEPQIIEEMTKLSTNLIPNERFIAFSIDAEMATLNTAKTGTATIASGIKKGVERTFIHYLEINPAELRLDADGACLRFIMVKGETVPSGVEIDIDSYIPGSVREMYAVDESAGHFLGYQSKGQRFYADEVELDVTDKGDVKISWMCTTTGNTAALGRVQIAGVLRVEE